MIFLQDLNTFFKDNGLYIALGVAAIVFVVVGILLLRGPRNRKKADNNVRFLPIINALGGIDNIIKSEAKISRLVVELVDAKLIDEEKLKQCGVEKLIKMSKKITLLVGDVSVEIQEVINEQKGT